MYKSQADAVKEWLQAYLKGVKKVDDMLERLRTIQARMKSVGAQELSDMPRPPSAPKDRMAEYVVQCESLELAIKKESHELELCRKNILDLTGQLKKPEARDMIRYRYLYGYEWSEIMKKLYSDRKDLAEKENAYRRKMYRLHESALKEMAKLWNKSEKSS